MAETQPGFAEADPRKRRLMLELAGRNCEEYDDGFRGDSFLPFVGTGTGGSSALYGMALERRLPHDFEGWPIGYDDLSSWYEKTERLYEVSGGADPLHNEGAFRAPAEPLSPANEVLFAGVRDRGLHPYRLRQARRQSADCGLCQGFLCDRNCKVDAQAACLAPALQSGRASLVAEMQVIAIEHEGRRVQAVVAKSADGAVQRYRGRVVAISAGALSTPRILLRSGVPDQSGLLGRRLMRHAIDLFVLTFAPRFARESECKELALNDFYAPRKEWLGSVQAFGKVPTLEYLRAQQGPNLWRTLGPAAAPLAAAFRNAPIVASILEDQPVVENRVEADAQGRGKIFWSLTEADRARRARFRRIMLRTFARFGPVPIFGTSDRKALGHVCGTAAFGVDPGNSVLDRLNRVHAFDNLFVVDGSFFPTSGGINPSLTIAANALRVADAVHRQALP
jgi:choline dehydrogenase-like flavoprotein